jgi:hypothetical protein
MRSAVVPGAAVVAKNVQTGAEFRAIANDVGVWAMLSVPRGSYKVNVDAQGFKTATFEEMVGGGATAPADAILQIGIKTEVVVTASRPRFPGLEG